MSECDIAIIKLNGVLAGIGISLIFGYIGLLWWTSKEKK